VVYAFRADLDSWWRAQSPQSLAAVEQPAHSSPVSRTFTLPPILHATSQDASTPQSSMRLRSFISQTIGIDPDSALAQAHLAVYFFTLAVVGLWSPTEAIPAAEAAARRALEIDPRTSEAHTVLGIVAGVHTHDWVHAAQRFDVALDCQSVSPLVRFHYATWHLSPLVRHDAALAQLEEGLAADPLYLLGRLQLALELQSVGRADEGLVELEHVAKMDPHFGPALGLLGRELAIRGRVEEAWPLAERTYAAAPRHPNAVGFLAGMLRRRGDTSGSRQLLHEFARQASWAGARAHAEAHIIFGEPEAAMEQLPTALEARDPGVWLLLAGTAGGLLRSTQDWPALRGRLKLPD
jgi:Tfp pilus assembly protein PilF